MDLMSGINVKVSKPFIFRKKYEAALFRPTGRIRLNQYKMLCAACLRHSFNVRALQMKVILSQIKN